MGHERGETEPVRIARIGLVGTLGAALLAAVAAVVVPILSSGGSKPTVTDAVQDVTVKDVTAEAQSGSITRIETHAVSGRVVMTGRAAPNVQTVVVIAGPKPSGGTYWAAFANLEEDGTWRAELRIDPPPIPELITYQAIFDTDAVSHVEPVDPVPLSCFQQRGAGCDEFASVAEYRDPG